MFAGTKCNLPHLPVEERNLFLSISSLLTSCLKLDRRMDDDYIKLQPDKCKSDPVSDKPVTEDEAQINVPIRKKKSLVNSKVPVKCKLSTKSKLSDKSRSLEKSQSIHSNKVLLTKSLDSVKALLAAKESSVESLRLVESIKKISRATSIGTFLKKKRRKKRGRRHNLITAKFSKFDSETVKKIARELIRKKGNSLLNVHPKDTKKKKHPK